MTDISRWLAEHVQLISPGEYSQSSRLSPADVRPVSEALEVWDAWPLQNLDGMPWSFEGGRQLWMALGSPRFDDPGERHHHARIHSIVRDGDEWIHLGPTMPDGFSPGSREWSGSAILQADGQTIVLYFTATGRTGTVGLSYEQRLFSAEATLALDSGAPRLTDWRHLTELVRQDGSHYMSTTEGVAEPGKVKAFRDPSFFRDVPSGHDFLFFAGSSAQSRSAYNGVVGAARSDRTAASGWTLLPPIISADGLNNELERPHVILHDNLYYLFWSTQRSVFNPAAATGPNGLYGMVSTDLYSGWQPINGSGLVFANPASAPNQAYSWFVLPDLSVTSFVDEWDSSDHGSRRFGGTFAPFVRLFLDGSSAKLKG